MASPGSSKISQQAEKIKEPAGIWHLKDFVNKRVREIENRYDYRYSVLILVFAGLMKDGSLNFEDLRGLSQEKIDVINALLTC